MVEGFIQSDNYCPVSFSNVTISVSSRALFYMYSFLPEIATQGIKC